MLTASGTKARLMDQFLRKTPGSKRLFESASDVSPGGVMAGIKHFEPYPLFMEKARGSRIWDVDGNEYIDYLMSYGALILGHGSQTAKKAIDSTLDEFGTTVTGTPTRVESEYGTMLRDIYHPDGMMRFTNSGLEATFLAVRLAKGYTGRKKVAKFEGHYHGAVEDLLFSYKPTGETGSAERPMPNPDSAEVDDKILSNSVVLPFNDWESTETLLEENSNELACVMLEPFEEGVIAAEASFMMNLRRLTQELGIPLIFDEVKTGFRVRLGGATEFYSLVPDITCLGKIIGGGLPIGAVVGSREIMQRLDPRADNGNRVFHSGTFNGNPLSLSVGLATVTELGKKGTFESLKQRTQGLKSSLSEVLSSHKIPHQACGEGAMFNFYVTEGIVRNYRDAQISDLRTRRLIDLALICEGVYLKPENRFCTSTAHTDEDTKLAATRLDEALTNIQV